MHNKNFEIPLEDIEETLEVPVLAVIPYDVNVLKALSIMEPLTMHKPKSEGSEEFKKLAAAMIGQKYKQTKLGNFFRMFIPKKQEINRLIFYDRVFK